MGWEKRRGKVRGRERKGAGGERGKRRERVIPVLRALATAGLSCIICHMPCYSSDTGQMTTVVRVLQATLFLLLSQQINVVLILVRV